MTQKLSSVLSFQASHNQQRWTLMVFVVFIYLLNFGVNDIWTPNESFYAEAVREMFESGNFLDIQYNYEPRYNKPPLTYWLMAGSAAIFGINEIGLRFPIILTGIGSIWLCYLLGRKIYGEKGGIYMLVLSAFSVQFLAVKQYASPEMPLTFFFILTLYWFYVGYHDRNKAFILLAYVALGFTVLTKGFPYIIVVGAIIGSYLAILNRFNFKKLWSDIRLLQLPIGTTVTALIGLSWVLYMHLENGQEFWEVYNRETFGRAFTKKTDGLKIDFYPGVIMWSIIPYSLAFLFAFVHWLRRGIKDSRVVFPFCWFMTMLVIFSLAKGKLPTYMIQAHPAFLLIIVPLLIDYKPTNQISKILWHLCFWFMVVLTIVAHFVAIFYLQLNPFLYLLPILTIAILILLVKNRSVPTNAKLLSYPFWALGFFLISFSTFLTRLEAYRPYDEIGRVINEDNMINKSTPIYIEKTLIHNIPFYAQRKVIRDATPESINSIDGESLALVRDENIGEYNSDLKAIWSGMIYDFGSESQFAKFITACLQAEQGDLEKFAKYRLIYRPN